MKCLLIDTSSSNVVVSIIDDDRIIYEYKKYVESDLASKILTIIDNGLRECESTIKEIDKIFIVNGPGSFTGVRVGVTVAKNIAWSLDKDIIPISSLELLATTPTDKKHIVPMIDARRGNVFSGIYDRNLNLVKSESLIDLKELLSGLDENYELVSNDNLEVDGLIKPNLDVLKVIKKHINDINVNPHKLNPRYLKLTEAEENLVKNG